MTQRLVVIGGDAAGMSAASQARRRRPVEDLEILAFEKSAWVSYSACGEPYHVAGDVDALEDLVARTPEEFGDRDIDVRIHHEVMEVDLDQRTLEYHDHREHRTGTVEFDQLMIGTGTRARMPDIEGLHLEAVHTLRTLDDAAVLRAHPDGYIQIADRAKDIIISGGENISSVEVEGVLMAHPADQLLAAVVAKPDDKWGEVPCAFVELKAGAKEDAAALIAFTRETLAGFKAPKKVVFQELPKTSTGKIQKFELRKIAKNL